jgi:hypothetical protein
MEISKSKFASVEAIIISTVSSAVGTGRRSSKKLVAGT